MVERRTRSGPGFESGGEAFLSPRRESDVERQPPRTTSDEIDLYIRTYMSLLRSSGEVRVRAFEEAHAWSNSSLHQGARDPAFDASAFGYAAARLPECMPRVRRLVMGQSHEQFEAEGMQVRDWERVRTRGRRRPLRFHPDGTLAVFVTSVSDIDDLVPIVTAYQIEWNKLHLQLRERRADATSLRGSDEAHPLPVEEAAAWSGLNEDDARRLLSALGAGGRDALAALAARPSELSVRLLNGSWSAYQRAAQRWWGGVEPSYLRAQRPRRPPVYFVSSNSHSLVNLLGAAARERQGDLLDWVRRENPENLAPTVERALAEGREDELSNLTYYLLRAYIHAGAHERRQAVQDSDRTHGLFSIESPGHVDVSAQVLRLADLDPRLFDRRVRVDGDGELSRSDAVIVNIDYPLGMAAYHHLSRLGQGVGEVRGVYVMGKAATLNGRVGDVMVSNVVHDEHSRSTFLMRNAFGAADVRPWLAHGTVLDNQKALTVRSAFLQNRDYMGVFYREGYTVLEMEAGPFLSAVYELVSPQRHPVDEILHLSNQVPFDLGLLHYASDTPYSRRQDLLSKSLSYFGVDATYACAIAIVRRILAREVERLAGR
ncbi:MAG: hypothetical protein RL199_340 [Pseudomonadota bacterium]|jgi:hypothetical protein